MKRKLALDCKYLKHQLHVEMVKHKETQKQLQETQTKLKNLEVLMELREKRSRHANPIYLNKNRATVTSQSLTNLNEGRSEILKGQRYIFSIFIYNFYKILHKIKNSVLENVKMKQQRVLFLY